MRRPILRLAAAGLLLLAGCAEDDATPFEPEVGGDLFQRYVALGNSITAGFQSAGINDSTQVRSYAYLLGQRAGASFNAPLIARPGCPRPFLSPLGLAGRVGGPNASDSCVRLNAPRIINNVAIPGENIGDLLNLTATPSVRALHQLMIGNRTQLQAMLDADPTLVSVWIGNNDALGAARAGNPALLTPAALFTARVDSVANVIAQAAPQDAILIGVVDANVIPLLLPGKYYYYVYANAVAQGQPSPFGRPVSADCAPGTAGANNFVSLEILGTTAPTISCAENAPLVLSTAEAAAVSERVAAFNAAIQAEAAERGWIFLNPNTTFAQALQDPTQIRKCQALSALPPTATAQQVGVAIATSCPSLTDPAVGFGNLISYDGFHPSTAAHVIVANTLAGLINEKHGLSLPTS